MFLFYLFKYDSLEEKTHDHCFSSCLSTCQWLNRFMMFAVLSIVFLTKWPLGVPIFQAPMMFLFYLFKYDSLEEKTHDHWFSSCFSLLVNRFMMFAALSVVFLTKWPLGVPIFQAPMMFLFYLFKYDSLEEKTHDHCFSSCLSLLVNRLMMFAALSIVFLTKWPLGPWLTWFLVKGDLNWSCIRED